MFKRFFVCLLVLCLLVVPVFAQFNVSSAWQGFSETYITTTTTTVVDYMPFIGIMVFILLDLLAIFSKMPLFQIMMGCLSVMLGGYVIVLEGTGILFSPVPEFALAFVMVLTFLSAGVNLRNR